MDIWLGHGVGPGNSLTDIDIIYSRYIIAKDIGHKILKTKMTLLLER
jgi:hypothetical protein